MAIEKVEDAAHANSLEAFSPDEVKRVIRKLDLHLMPLCFVLYTFSVLDRSNLGNAKLAGMEEDIDLSGDKYAWLGTAFYIAYILFQFTTLGWKIFKPHRWVSFVVLFWGTISTMQAVCTSWSGLMACRFLLGVAETMFGPGVPLYFSYFYPREAMGLRFGLFLSGAALANAYGGALAYALSTVHSSISSWKFLFIIEGVPTALIAVLCWFFIPDGPSTAKFLTPREQQIAEVFARRQPEDQGESELRFGNLFDAFKDYRNWMFAFTNFSTNVSFASLPLFLPTIISDMGAFDTLTSNGLSAPPYLLCFFLIVIISFVSDRVRARGPFACGFAVLASVGYLIVILADGVAARYFGIFLVVLIFVTVSVNLVWNANTNENESKRAGGLWLIMTVGQCGTLLGTNMFPSTDKPRYYKGMWIGFAFSMVAAVLTGTLSYLLWRENKRRDKVYGRVTPGQEGVISEGRPAEATMRYII
ncbi:MFS general substrate transporter [Thozetella sp. PMI_491]|nr:MFS general substrate transporter [Thozetella sp. PMI_491]